MGGESDEPIYWCMRCKDVNDPTLQRVKYSYARSAQAASQVVNNPAQLPLQGQAQPRAQRLIAVQSDEVDEKQEMHAFLRACKLEKYREALYEIGIVALSDFDDLETEDVKEIARQAQMKSYQANVLIRCVAKLKAGQNARREQVAVEAKF